MEKLIITWAIGWVIAGAMIFIGSRDMSDDIIERLMGSLILGVLSWLYVAIVITVHLLKRGSGKKGGAR